MKSAFRRADDAAYEQLPVTERCIHCPDWVFHGSAIEGRIESEAHRAEFHPNLVQRKLSRRHVGHWIQLTQKEQREIADEERRRRMFLLGI